MRTLDPTRDGKPLLLTPFQWEDLGWFDGKWYWATPETDPQRRWIVQAFMPSVEFIDISGRD